MAEQQHHSLPELTLLLSTRSRNKQQRKAKCSCACSWPRTRGGTGHGQRARAWPSLTGWFLLLGSASTAAAAASGAACTTHWASKEGQAAPSHTPISCQNKRAESHCLALDTSPNLFRAELFFFSLSSKFWCFLEIILIQRRTPTLAQPPRSTGRAASGKR